MDKLKKNIIETCNPFDQSNELLNLATGKAARPETKNYLLGTLERGSNLRHLFETECQTDKSRFLKSVGKTKVRKHKT